MNEEKENEIEKTSLYSIDEFEDSLVSSTLKEVCVALKEKGYNPINQLVGYWLLLSVIYPILLLIIVILIIKL